MGTLVRNGLGDSRKKMKKKRCAMVRTLGNGLCWE